MIQLIFSLLLIVLLAACTTTEAPVIEGWKQGKAETSDYRVQPGDTVYSIAWAFDVDYRQIVQLNNLHEPYQLHTDQLLHMSANNSKLKSDNVLPTSKFTAQPSVQQISQKPHLIATKPISTKSPTIKKITSNWLWPTSGKVVRGFSATSGGNKGIDISGKIGQPVVATATGKVVYTGASLPGYGNLIIIKHSDNDLSAYAFNKVIAVKEGQMVKAGQMIAKMGKNDVGKTILHFEIREEGKPTNPLPFLRGIKK